MAKPYRRGKLLSLTLSLIYQTYVTLVLVLDSKDLLTSLSTKKNLIRGEVNVRSHYFETKDISHMVWVPVKENQEDPSTKSNSNLTEAHHLMLHDGRLPFDFTSAESCSSDRILN